MKRWRLLNVPCCFPKELKLYRQIRTARERKIVEAGDAERLLCIPVKCNKLFMKLQ